MVKDNMKQYVPTDIRLRDWMTLDTRVSHILRLLIETENILIELDDYQREHNQCYEDLEDFNLKLFVYRKEFTKYIDEHPELLEIDKYLNEKGTFPFFF